MFYAISLNKKQNTVCFYHYNTTKQYDISPDVLRWIESRAKMDGWKHKPNGFKFDGARYVRITSDNDPYPFYWRKGIRFMSIVINWTNKTIRFTNLYHKDRTYTVKSIKRLRHIATIIDTHGAYTRYETENWSNWSARGRKLYKYSCWTIR